MLFWHHCWSVGVFASMFAFLLAGPHPCWKAGVLVGILVEVPFTPPHPSLALLQLCNVVTVSGSKGTCVLPGLVITLPLRHISSFGPAHVDSVFVWAGQPFARGKDGPGVVFQLFRDRTLHLLCV